MYNLRDEKGTMKAKVPHDVVSRIIQQQIVTFFNDRRNKVCLRVTQNTTLHCFAGLDPIHRRCKCFCGKVIFWNRNEPK